jgi:chromosome segregation ATPase
VLFSLNPFYAHICRPTHSPLPIQELESHRALSAQSSQWDGERRDLLRQISTLESSIHKHEHEVRERNHELRIAREDLDRERESVGALKSALAQVRFAFFTVSFRI